MLGDGTKNLVDVQIKADVKNFGKRKKLEKKFGKQGLKNVENWFEKCWEPI